VDKSNRDFNEIINTIRKSDPRYARGAYYFLRKALDFSISELRKQGKLESTKHLTGQQLLEGIRLFALEQYGPMTLSVFNHWGIKNCRDFGNIVFNLVDSEVLGKTEEDCPEDFDGGYDFKTAFEAPYRHGS